MRKRLIFSFLLATLPAVAAEFDPAAILPPATSWSGESRSLIAPKDDPWITPAETSAFRFSPSYDETVAWLKKLDAASPELQMVSLAKSPEGRDIWMVIASKERAFTPEALRRSGKSILFAHGGIHAGEIDGKDAGLMLLRDMTARGRRRDLLDRANLLFIPILNVDGHERRSRFTRMNQRGPEIMGWRTNARNLNLNRDYTKLDTEEIRAVVRVLDRWQPDLYLDLHVTDGADYQYDITFGWNDSTGFSPQIVQWLDSTLRPAFDKALRAAGHIPGHLVFPVDNQNPANGISLGNSGARLSTGYGDVRNVATVLVENHSLKPYDQRVLGTAVLLASAMETVAASGSELRKATAADRTRRIDPIPLDWTSAPAKDGDVIERFLGIESRRSLSPLSGDLRMEWLGRPAEFKVQIVRNDKLVSSAARPKAWWIPVSRTDIAERMKLHGITLEKIASAREIEVAMYRLDKPTLDVESFEGRVGIKTTGAAIERRTERFPAGSWRVPADQPLGNLAALLLEPLSPESYLRWGFMHEILHRTEYAESYVTEPMAEQMLARDPKLAAEFQQKLTTDPTFRASAEERLRFFHRRSPFWDDRWLLYPVAREE